MNKLITNKQVSIVALAPLLDASGNALVLKPKGTKGDECEITEETAEDEIVKRVEKAGWVRVRPVGGEPASAPPKAPPAPPPPPSEPPAVVAPPPAPEATQVMPVDEVATLVEQTKSPEPEPALETPPPASEPPTRVKRDRR